VGASCEFDVIPATPYTWDESCVGSVPGCDADGKHVQCRFCGTTPFLPCQIEGRVPPPASPFCKFKVPPTQAFTWDDTCTGGVPGCGADGHHLQCRFCGDAPFKPCPKTDTGDKCVFDWTPSFQYTWDETCEDGKHGCKADDKHMYCRFCGGPYDPCPTCKFDEEPNKPYGVSYIWDSSCLSEKYMHGCNADGKHLGCRFCGKGYEPCPTTTATSTTATATTTTTLLTTSTQTTTTVTTVTTTTRRGLRFKDYSDESKTVSGNQLACLVQLAVMLCLVTLSPLHL